MIGIPFHPEGEDEPKASSNLRPKRRGRQSWLSTRPGESMKKEFQSSSREEANKWADEWWAAQRGVRNIQRTEISLGTKGLSIKDAEGWAVTIHYERDREKPN